MYDKNPPENGGFVSNLRAAENGRPLISSKAITLFVS